MTYYIRVTGKFGYVPLYPPELLVLRRCGRGNITRTEHWFLDNNSHCVGIKEGRNASLAFTLGYI